MSKEYINNNPGEYSVYSSQKENNGELGKIDTYDYDGEYLTWTTDGKYAGSIFYRNEKFSITNVCGLLDVKDKSSVYIKYLKYILSIKVSDYVNQGMGNPKLMSNVMGNIEVYIPDFHIQKRIADVLDNFDIICTNFNIGLPKEIDLRKKQYEYYRNLLLTFPTSGGGGAI